MLQPHRWVEEKKRGLSGGYVKHGLAHYATALLLGLLPDLSRWASASFHLVVLGLVVVYVLLDIATTSLLRPGKIAETAWTFLLDQFLHSLFVLVAAFLIARPSWAEVAAGLAELRSHDREVLLTLVVYVAVIFGGGHLVRHATKRLTAGEPLISGESQEQLRNAGMYIGWLERFLVVSALLLESPAAVGLILTAKSVVRYPELKSVRFAEYFLIGTLLSISIAIFGGVVLIWVLRQHPPAGP